MIQKRNPTRLDESWFAISLTIWSDGTPLVNQRQRTLVGVHVCSTSAILRSYDANTCTKVADGVLQAAEVLLHESFDLRLVELELPQRRTGRDRPSGAEKLKMARFQ